MRHDRPDHFFVAAHRRTTDRGAVPLALVYEVRGEGFLRHMVRIIVGTLVEIGRGRYTAVMDARGCSNRDRARRRARRRRRRDSFSFAVDYH